MSGNSADKQKLATACWVTLAILCASIEPVVVKVGYENALSPWQLLVARSVVGALLILPLTRAWRLLDKDEFCQILMLSILLFITNSLTLLALSELSAVCLITVLTTTPAIVAVLNERLGRDVLNAKFWVGFACCFFGVVMGLDYGDARYSLIGLLPALGAVFSSSIYRVRCETVLQTVSPALVSTYVFLINGVMVALFIWPFAGHLPQQAWMFGGWMGLTAAAASVAFLMVLSFVGSTRISIFNMLQRPLIVVIAAFVLHEQLTVGKIIGLTIALIGIQLATVSRTATGKDTESGRPSEVSCCK